MFNRNNRIQGPSHLSAESSRQILCKLRDVNLSGQRFYLTGGQRVDFGGCLDPQAPIFDRVFYRLVLNGTEEWLLSITIKRGRLCLALGRAEDKDAERSRWLNLVEDENGRVGAPQIKADLAPDTTLAPEVETFLRDLALACLPAC